MTGDVTNKIVVGGPAGRTSTPQTKSKSLVSVETGWLFWCYLGLVAGAEMLTSLVSPVVGMLAHLLLLVGLLVHSSLGRTEGEQKLALALTLAPMIRLLSLSMPLIDFPKEMWFPLVSVPLLVAAFIITRQIKMDRKALRLRIGNPAVQILIVLGGLALGVTEYAILRPEPLVAQVEWQQLAIAAFSLLVFTGFNEEVIFRGLMQSTALPVLGSKAVMYVALLFGVLHIGYLSIFDLVFVSAVGLLFGYLVLWSGSLLGVTFAHGLTNITLFLVMPNLVEKGLFELANMVVWAGAASGLVLLAVTLILWRESLLKARSVREASRKPATRFPLPSSMQVPRFVEKNRRSPELRLEALSESTRQAIQSAPGTQLLSGAATVHKRLP